MASCTYGETGYGLLGLTKPGCPSREEAYKALRAAVQSGYIPWDGGEHYGSLPLLRDYFTMYPDDASKVVLNIKGGQRGQTPDGSPKFIRESVENCLQELDGTVRIDMFECARRDPKTPIEDTLRTLDEFVKEGKIGGVALTEVSAQTIRKATKITTIVAVEIELSLLCTDPLGNGIAQACFDLDIPILAYSPLGRGFLTGHLRTLADISKTDFRRHFPRFQVGNFETNFRLVQALEGVAEQKQCTLSQVALGWLRGLSKCPNMPRIIPIPGASTPERVRENAVLVELNENDFRSVDAILEEFEIVGDRYPEFAMPYING